MAELTEEMYQSVKSRDMDKANQRAALEAAMSQGQEVTVFIKGDELTGYLADVSEDTFRFRGGCDLSYDDLGSVQVVAKVKTIKEKARIAWERDLEVVVKSIGGHITTGRVIMCHPYNIEVKYREPNGEMYIVHPRYEHIADIRFVDEQAEGKEMPEGISMDEVIRTSVIPIINDYIQNLDVGNKDENARLQTEVEKLREVEAEDAKTINGQDKRIREHISKIAELEERLVALEADQEIETEECAPDSQVMVISKLHKAKEENRRVTIHFSDSHRSGTINSGIETIGLDRVVFSNTADGEQYVFLNSITFVEIGNVISQSDEPEEEPDIAEQRWMVYGGVCGVEIRQRCDGRALSLALVRHGSLDGHIKLVATDAQIALATAAPELADMLRDLLAHRSIEDGVSCPLVLDAIRLLNKHGIPNVAPWYKDDNDN